MPKFRIKLVGQAAVVTVVEIEAEDASMAKENAIAQVKKGEWEFVTNIQADNCDELPFAKKDSVNVYIWETPNIEPDVHFTVHEAHFRHGTYTGFTNHRRATRELAEKLKTELEGKYADQLAPNAKVPVF